MKFALLYAAACAAAISLTLFIASSSASREQAIDCSLASFHPDYTTAMRQACREAQKQQ